MINVIYAFLYLLLRFILHGYIYHISNTIIDYCKDKTSVYILRPKIKGQKVD